MIYSHTSNRLETRMEAKTGRTNKRKRKEIQVIKRRGESLIISAGRFCIRIPFTIQTAAMLSLPLSPYVRIEINSRHVHVIGITVSFLSN